MHHRRHLNYRSLLILPVGEMMGWMADSCTNTSRVLSLSPLFPERGFFFEFTVSITPPQNIFRPVVLQGPALLRSAGSWGGAPRCSSHRFRAQQAGWNITLHTYYTPFTRQLESPENLSHVLLPERILHPPCMILFKFKLIFRHRRLVDVRTETPSAH